MAGKLKLTDYTRNPASEGLLQPLQLGLLAFTFFPAIHCPKGWSVVHIVEDLWLTRIELARG